MSHAAIVRPRRRALVIVRMADTHRLGDAPPDLSMFGSGAVNALDAAEEARLGQNDYNQANTVYQQAFQNWKLNEAQRQALGMPSLPMPVAPDPAHYAYSNPQVNYESGNNNYQPLTIAAGYPAATAQAIAPAPVPTAPYVAPDFTPGAAPLTQQQAVAQAQYDGASAAQVAQVAQQQQQQQQQIDAINAKALADANAAAALRAQVAATLAKAQADQQAAAAANAATQAQTLAQQQQAYAQAQQAQQAAAAALTQQQLAQQQQQLATTAQSNANQQLAQIVTTTQNQALLTPVTASSITSGTLIDNLKAGGGLFTQPVGNVLPSAVNSALPAVLTSTPVYLAAAAAAVIAYAAFAHHTRKRR